MRPWTRSVLVLPALVAVLAAAGCGADDAAKPVTSLPVPSSTSASASAAVSSPSSTPTSSVSRSPFDKLSAQEFVQRYYAALNHGFATGDFADARAITLDYCPCRDQFALIEKQYAEGKHLEGGVYTIGSFTTYLDPAVTVDFDYAITAITVKDAAGNVTAADASTSGRRRALLRKTSDGSSWVVEKVNILQ